MGHKGHFGTSMGGYSTISKNKKKRMDRARRAEERKWQQKSGPVTTYRIDPETGERVPVE